MTATVVSSSQINLSWNQPADQGGSGIARYRVMRDGVQLGLLITATSATDTTTLAGTTYTYTVFAQDGGGNWSPQSAPAVATTPNNLGAVLNRTSWTYLSVFGQTPSFDPNVVVTASGGSGSGYTYQWERLSGDTQTTASAPTGSSTRWQRTLPTQSSVFTSTWRCRVSDSAGTVIYTPTVTVTFERENGD